MRLETYFAETRGAQAALARALKLPQSLPSAWAATDPKKRRTVPAIHCVAIEQSTAGVVTRRDLRPDDWRSIWPELEEVERLRAQVAQLMERLRKYEPNAVPALSSQAPAAINTEARPQAQEVAHG